MNYAQVVVFKKVGEFDDALTYALPQANKNVQVGQFVTVPFRRRSAPGLVVGFLDNLPADLPSEKVREIEAVSNLSLSPASVKLAHFIARYYQTSITRALKMFIPKKLWSGKLDPPEKKPVKNPHSPFAFEKTLTASQQQVIEKVTASTKPVLLHGVTGSGKTEVYLRLIDRAIRRGEQAILLVPEISLTPQMADYFNAVFQGQVAVFHSGLTDKQRWQEWWRVKNGQAKLVIGSRSAIFAPIDRLGIIIIDEEHEWTYKQESAPYYHTRPVAEFLASEHGAKLLLGSATPSIESYHRVKAGGFVLAELPERINQSPLPAIRVVDLREEFQKKNFSIFSNLLQQKIKSRLESGEQVILFVNQRGLASAVVCRDCGYTEKCPHCDISLKYHRGNPDQLMCHYCTFTKSPAIQCPSCKSPYIKHAGVGTQRVEEELKKLFPTARVARADRDTVKPGQFDAVYQDFKAGKYDVLIGTQMVAKGLDFEKVSLIGIVLADIGLHIPDFRSAERLFQLIIQVAGRCGRAKHEGEVVLQTYNPNHFVIQRAAEYDYHAFVEDELKHRAKFDYPPYNRLIKFTVVGMDPAKLEKHIQEEEEVLQDIFKTNHLPVKILSAPALVPKIKNRYYYHVLLRSEKPEVVFKHWNIPKTWRVDIDPIHTT